MAKYDAGLRTDTRVTDLLLRKGLLPREEYDRALKALKDSAGNAEYIPAYSEEDATPPARGKRPTFEAA